MTKFSDLTLDELRLAMAPTVAEAAIFDGWSADAVAAAANDLAVDPDVAALAFPGGAMDMITAWIETIDANMTEALPQDVLAKMPIRERIRSQIQFRLDAVVGLEEALRRALAVMAMPQNAKRTLKTGWHSADIMWRLAGDVATDYNHYTKRTILAGIYGATLAVFVGDESEGKADTKAFLARRIDGVMKFEKAKAKMLNSDREQFSLTRLLGRLRYPAR